MIVEDDDDDDDDAHVDEQVNLSSLERTLPESEDTFHPSDPLGPLSLDILMAQTLFLASCWLPGVAWPRDTQPMLLQQP